MKTYLGILALPAVAHCGDVLWSGLFDKSAEVADFDECPYHFPQNT